MTRREFIEVLAADRELSRDVAEAVVDAFFDRLRDALLHGQRVELRGFGSFSLRRYDGYTARHPRTRAPIQVRPKVLPVFRAAKELKERVDGKAR